MKIKKYLKILWRDIVNNESGQVGMGYNPYTGKYEYPDYKPKATGSTNIIRTPINYNPYTTGSTNIIRDTTPKTTPATTAATPVTSQTPALSAALNYSYTPTTMPAYDVPQYNVNLPTVNWGFNPTEAQRGGWQTQAQATAALEIDPQLQAIKAALDQYLAQGQVQRDELNPRYTNQSLAIANIIQNSVKQEAIDNAIRRGAEQSGWLPSALMEAGKLETQQRGGVEAQRNQELAALAALEGQQTQAAGEQSTTLEGLRGQRITTALAELENLAWQRDLQEKLNQWNAALSGEQLRASTYGDYAQNMLGAYQTQASIGQSNADRALQAAIAAANQGNVQYQQQYTAAQDAYQKQLAAAQQAQGNVASKDVMVSTPYGMLPIQVANALGYVKQGEYAQGANSDFENWIMSQLQ